MQKQILIEGMSCGHCVDHVKGALEDMGATQVQVSLEKKMATITVGDTDDQSIREAVEGAGYDVIKIENI